MRRIILLYAIVFFCGNSLSGQYAYAPDMMNGDLYRVDLSNTANNHLIGVGVGSLGGADFGPMNILYAISNSGGFYIIDTLSGASNSIGTITPLPGHMWTGLAYDPTKDVLYASSTTGNTESAFFTIDIASVTATLIGTTTTAQAIVDIAFDPQGQMYAYNLPDVMYLIDKSNGSVSVLGNSGGNSAQQWHGLGYCYTNNEMYLSTYDIFTWEISLYKVNLTNGSTTFVGLTGFGAGDLAMVHPGLSHPIIGFDTDSIIFDTTLVNMSNQKSLVVYNNGGDTLKVTDIISFDTTFKVNITNFEVLPGDSQLVQVTFTPKTAMFYSTYLNIISNDPYSGTFSIYVSGYCETATGIRGKENDTQISIYPNPFSNHTTIGYTLQKPSDVTMKIYDLNGREINTLINKFQAKGKHGLEWNGCNYNDTKLRPGVYIYKIYIDDCPVSGRITITK